MPAVPSPRSIDVSDASHLRVVRRVARGVVRRGVRSTRVLVLLGLALCAAACAESAPAKPGQDANPPDVDPASDVAPADVPCGDADNPSNLNWRTMITPGCTRYLASIHVPDASATDALEPLAGLRRVDGTLSIFRPHVELDVSPLAGLEVVGGDLLWRFDDVRADLEGLAALREVGGLRIENNPALTRLSGLSGLTTVHGDLVLRYNPSLPRETVEALLARVTVGGDVLLDD